MRKEVRKPGRPFKIGEVLSEERKIKFAPSVYERLEKRALETGVSVPEQVRQAVDHDLNRVEIDWAAIGADVVRAKLVTQAECGNWSEAIERAFSFVFTRQMAEWLGIQDGDVVVQAIGDSMKEIGILDGSLVIMRPVPAKPDPPSGRAYLVQRIDEDGTAESLIKFWFNTSPRPTLKDGAGNVIAIPETTTRLQPVAEATGVITKL